MILIDNLKKEYNINHYNESINNNKYIHNEEHLNK